MMEAMITLAGIVGMKVILRTLSQYFNAFINYI